MPKTRRKFNSHKVKPRKPENEPASSVDDHSSIDAPNSELVPWNLRSEDKMERWVGMINSASVTGNINEAFIRILGEIEANLIQSLGSFQENILSTLENKFGTLVNQHVVKVYTSSYLKELKKKLEVDLPIADLEVFEEFDAELENNIEKQNALRYLFHYFIDSDKGLTHDITTLINAVANPSVQMLYTGIGKIHKGQQKMNFSQTNVYLCMQDVLIDKYKQSADSLKLIGRISRWLSQVNDRINKLHKRRIQRLGKPNSDSEGSLND